MGKAKESFSIAAHFYLIITKTQKKGKKENRGSDSQM